MLQWRNFGFSLLIILQYTKLSIQQPSDFDSINKPTVTTPKPAGNLGFNPNGPTPFGDGPNSPINGQRPNNNDPKMSNMPMFPPLPPGCKTVSGTWYNEVGSRIVITQGADNNLTGTFYTQRQSDPGEKKPLKANIIGGAAFIGNSMMLGFIVSWGDNGYTTVWTGQCYSCGKEEIIETNWLMREPVKDCVDKWHANRFGHSTFRKSKPVDVPDEDIADKDDVPSVPPYKKPPISEGNDTCSSIDGVWFNELGAKLDVEIKDDGTMQGIYDLPAMIKMAKAAKVIGTSFYKESGSFGFCSINEDGKVLTCWVGQCQKCKINETEMVMLDTYVANRLWVPTCLEEFRTTAYGGNRFTRQNLAPPMIPMHMGPVDHASPMDHQGSSNMNTHTSPMDHAGTMDHQGSSNMNKPPNSINNPDYIPDKQKPSSGITDTTTAFNMDKITTKKPPSSDQ